MNAVLICGLLLAAASSPNLLGFSPEQVEYNEDGLGIPVVLMSAPQGEVAALQFDLRFDPAVWAYVRVEPGDASRGADKSTHGNPVAPGHVRVIVAGLNQNIIPSGTIATVQLRRAGETILPLRISAERPILSDPVGNALDAAFQPDSLAIDPAHRSAVGSTSTSASTPESAMHTLARYRALLFAGVLVAAIMVLARRTPRKGRAR